MRKHLTKLLFATVFSMGAVGTMSGVSSCSGGTNDTKCSVAGDTSNLTFTKINDTMTPRQFQIKNPPDLGLVKYQSSNLPEGVTLSNNGILSGSNDKYCAGKLQIYLINDLGDVCSNKLIINYKTIIQAKDLCNIAQGDDTTGLVVANSKDDTIKMNGVQKVKPYLADILALANANIKNTHSNYHLWVRNGYRSYDTQEQNFMDSFEAKYDYPPELDPTKVSGTAEWNKIQSVHEKIAYPYCAGHPSGGAVDIYVYNQNNESIGFGDGANATYDISEGAGLNNRLLLLNAMVDAGFTPYYGEYWHFMYGDIEWAAANKQDKSIYKQSNYS